MVRRCWRISSKAAPSFTRLRAGVNSTERDASALLRKVSNGTNSFTLDCVWADAVPAAHQSAAERVVDAKILLFMLSPLIGGLRPSSWSAGWRGKKGNRETRKSDAVTI
jgi:hypothetical protein